MHSCTAPTLSCSSVVRQFRYASTLTAVQLVTSWLHVMGVLSEARDTAGRQQAAEKKKGNKVRPGMQRWPQAAEGQARASLPESWAFHCMTAIIQR